MSFLQQSKILSKKVVKTLLCAPILMFCLFFSSLHVCGSGHLKADSNYKIDIDNIFKHPNESLTPYRIGSNDELTIKCYNYPEIDTIETVDSKGEITLPLLGDINIGGLTTDEADRMITDLLNQDYLYSPEVSVDISKYQSRKVFLLGHLSQTGAVYLTTNTRILDILATAHVSDSTEEFYADKKIMILRKTTYDDSLKTGTVQSHANTTDGVRTLAFNLKELFVSKNGDINIELQHNDVIFVSDVQNFYIIGEVRNPGTYALTDNITVIEAISKAGGFTSAASKAIHIIRTIEGEQKKLKAKMDDFIQPGDIIESKVSLF
ncbi:polysaccharide biosynthesis/export family protein [Acidobacteriota bacterium]